MLKLSRLLLHSSRDHFSSQSMVGVAANDFKLLRGVATQAWASTSTPNLEPSARIFAPYTIYKGKAALSANPLLPKFTKTESGDYRVERRGSIMLTFWPAIGERKYDWDKRQKFALSATEVGSLINLGAKDSCEFFHDPSMQSSNAGQVRKNLSVKAHADGSGYFVSLSVVSNVLQTNDFFVVPVTAAEFAVMRTAFSFALPHIMGWDHTLRNLPIQNSEGSSSIISSKQGWSKAAPEAQSIEWDR